MAARTDKTCRTATLLKQFAHFTKDEEKFLSVQRNLTKKLPTFIKSLYDFTKANEKIKRKAGSSLPELLISGFDEEQIWQELELQNSDCLAQCLKFVSNVSVKNLSLHVQNDSSHEADMDEADAMSFNNDSPSSDAPPAEVEFSDPEVDLDDSGSGDVASMDSNQNERVGRTSTVDDSFFNLADMEAFLDEEDKREDMKYSKKQKTEDEDEEIDLFQDISSSSASSSDDEGSQNIESLGLHEKKSTRDFTYADFFDPPQGDCITQKKTKRVKFEMSPNDGGEKTTDTSAVRTLKELPRKNLLQSSSDEEPDIVQSSYEKRQSKIKQRIEQLEQANLTNLLDKPWQLAGEVGANLRPENSLLEEHLDFDHTTRLPPVVTENTTKSLEDLITQRIKDQAWDDVQRKEKPKDEPFEYKKRITLDQEKSKMSLSQVYEEEFLKKQQVEKQEVEEPAHAEIRKMMESLFHKLDALSNFHYTPKMPVPDVKIVSNMPTIAMEDVAPVTTSDATLLAPEEVKEKKKGEIKGTTEKSITDKKRERRGKKKRQHMKRLRKEKKDKSITKLNVGLGNKYSKRKAIEKLAKDTSGNRTTILQDDTKQAKKSSLTSSKEFFTQLQEEVSKNIKAKKESKNKTRKKQNDLSVAKLKL